MKTSQKTVSNENPTISLTAAASARKAITTMKHRNWKSGAFEGFKFYISGLLAKPDLLLRMEAEEVTERKKIEEIMRPIRTG